MSARGERRLRDGIRTFLAAGCAALWIAWSGSSASAQSFLEQLERRLTGEAAEQQPSAPGAEAEAGGERPGYLGLVADDARPPQRGVEVLSVRGGGPAELGGIRSGDRILAVDDQPVEDLDGLAQRMERMPAGARVTFRVAREDDERQVEVVLGVAPGPERQDPAGDAEGVAADETRLPAPEPERQFTNRASLGVTVVSVSDESRRRYGLSLRRGAVVSAIQPGSPADRVGLPLGAAIVAADGQRVDTPDDLLDILAGLRGGDEIELAYYHGPELLRRTVRLAPAGMPVDAPRPDARVDDGGDFRLGREGGLTENRDRGRRPVLNRLGRALDGIVGAAGGGQPFDEGPQPFERPMPAVGELERLQRQLDEMQAEMDRLRARIEQLERRDTAPNDEGPRLRP